MNQRARGFSTTLLLSLALLMLSYQNIPVGHASSLPNIGIWSEAYNSPDIADPTIQPNTTMIVDINVTNAPAFNGYDLTLYFDPAYLQIQFVNVRSGAFANPFIGAEDISRGQIRLAVVNLGAPFTGGYGILAQIDFNVTGNGVSPLVLAAATTQPSGQAYGWTQLVFGYTEIPVSTSDGYFSNVPGNPGPIASFTVIPSSPRTGDTLTFNATDSIDPDNSTAQNQGIAIYSWDFGDGQLLNSSTPIMTYTYETYGYPYLPFTGNFSARLTVLDSDNHFEGMITKLVEVSPICPPGLVAIEVPRDCPTIQAAIDSVAPGGVIHVAPGSYLEKPVVQKPLTLEGSGNGTILEGLIQVQAPNVSISEFRIISNPFALGTGIELNGASGADIRNNLIIGQRDPLNLEIATLHGITVADSKAVSIQNNTVVYEQFGISLSSSPYSLLRDNTLTNNAFNLDVSNAYAQDIDSSNTVNGRPVFYLTSGNYSQVPMDAGYVALVNAHDIVISSLDTSYEGQGVLIVNSTRITIDHLNATHVLAAAKIVNSVSTSLSNSLITSGTGAIEPCGGIELDNSQKTTLENNTIACPGGITLNGSSLSTVDYNSVPGITLLGSSLNSIDHNLVSTGHASPGIDLEDSFANQFVDNRVISLDPSAGGFDLLNSTGNLLANNRMDGRVDFVNSSRNTLEDNIINATFRGFGVFSSHTECGTNEVLSCKRLPDYIQDIDPTNSINGRPIYYLVNRSGISVPSDAGFVAIVNSTDILVQNISPSFNIQDILVISSRSVRIIDNNIANAIWGISGWNDTELTITNNAFSEIAIQAAIEVEDSSYGAITGNLITDSFPGFGVILRRSAGFQIDGNIIGDPGFATFPGIGIDLEGSSNNSLFRNTILGGGGTTGIRFGQDLSGSTSKDNMVVGNTLANHNIGLDAGQSQGNIVYGNNFLNNRIQARGGAGDSWSDQTGRGNYWSDYSGQDTDHDGIGDTLLPVLGLDSYPLMVPWTPTGVASNLTGRAAWPQIRRLSISRQGSNAQTLFALSNNTGTVPEWVEAIFNITSSDGSTLQLISRPVWTDSGGQTRFSVNLPVVPGSYNVIVTIRYSSDAYQKWISGNSKTFSFRVVS